MQTTIHYGAEFVLNSFRHIEKSCITGDLYIVVWMERRRHTSPKSSSSHRTLRSSSSPLILGGTRTRKRFQTHAWLLTATDFQLRSKKFTISKCLSSKYQTPLAGGVLSATKNAGRYKTKILPCSKVEVVIHSKYQNLLCQL